MKLLYGLLTLGFLSCLISCASLTGSEKLPKEKHPYNETGSYVWR